MPVSSQGIHPLINMYILKVVVEFMQSHQKAFENPKTAFRELMEETSIEELDKFLAECKFYTNF